MIRSLPLVVASLACSLAHAQSCPTDFELQTPGTRTLDTIAVHNVYWGDYWLDNYSETETIDGETSAIVNYSGVYLALQEYNTSGNPTLRGVFAGSDRVGATGLGLTVGKTGSYDDAAITAELQSQLESTLITRYLTPPFPYYPIYVIWLPPGITSTLEDNAGVSGHHSRFDGWDSLYEAQSGEPAGKVLYIVMRYRTDAKWRGRVQSHEIYETITNPIGGGWRDKNNTSNEIGDVCEGKNDTLAEVTLQWVYSKAACACVAPSSYVTSSSSGGHTGGGTGGGGSDDNFHGGTCTGHNCGKVRQ
jgi:hypothetical protein